MSAKVGTTGVLVSQIISLARCHESRGCDRYTDSTVRFSRVVMINPAIMETRYSAPKT